MKRADMRTISAITSVIFFIVVAGVAVAQSDQQIDALDPQALAISDKCAVDSLLASDVYLVQVMPSRALQLDSGTAEHWLHVFYSPSKQAFARVVVGKPTAGPTSVRSMKKVALASGESPPIAIDTSIGIFKSRVFAQALRDNVQHQQYRVAYPSHTVSSFELRTVSATEDQDELEQHAGYAAWIVTYPTVGDSLNVCISVPGRAIVACFNTFSLEVGGFNRYSRSPNVSFALANDGSFGMSYRGTGLYESPRGSGIKYLAGAGLWIGAQRRIGDSLVPSLLPTFTNRSAVSWATPGEALISRREYSRPIAHSSLAVDSISGEPAIADEKLRWPLWTTDERQLPSMLRPGKFVLQNGDRVPGSLVRPAFAANVGEQFVARFHDLDLSNYEFPDINVPFGLQFQQNVFADIGISTGNAIVQYEIVNISDDTLFETVLAPSFDFDLGSSGDDASKFVTDSPELRTVIAYSRSASQPKMAIAIIEGPMLGASGRINNALRERFNSEGRVAGYSSWKFADDPITTNDHYARITTDTFYTPSGYGDYRGAMATQRFTMYPGDTAFIAFAFIPFTGSEASALSEVRYLTDVYYEQPRSSVTLPPAGTLGGISIMPVPAVDVLDVRFANAPIAGADVRVIDNTGTLRYAGTLDVGSRGHRIDVHELASGRYTMLVTSGSRRVAREFVIIR